MRSDQVKDGIERMSNRALLYATGVTPDQMRKPFIGVCSGCTHLIPGHIGMRYSLPPRELIVDMIESITEAEIHQRVAGAVRTPRHQCPPRRRPRPASVSIDRRWRSDAW